MQQSIRLLLRSALALGAAIAAPVTAAPPARASFAPALAAVALTLASCITSWIVSRFLALVPAVTGGPAATKPNEPDFIPLATTTTVAAAAVASSSRAQHQSHPRRSSSNRNGDNDSLSSSALWIGHGYERSSQSDRGESADDDDDPVVTTRRHQHVLQHGDPGDDMVAGALQALATYFWLVALALTDVAVVGMLHMLSAPLSVMAAQLHHWCCCVRGPALGRHRGRRRGRRGTDSTSMTTNDRSWCTAGGVVVTIASVAALAVTVVGVYLVAARRTLDRLNLAGVAAMLVATLLTALGHTMELIQRYSTSQRRPPPKRPSSPNATVTVRSTAAGILVLLVLASASDLPKIWAEALTRSSAAAADVSADTARAFDLVRVAVPWTAAARAGAVVGLARAMPVWSPTTSGDSSAWVGAFAEGVALAVLGMNARGVRAWHVSGLAVAAGGYGAGMWLWRDMAVPARQVSSVMRTLARTVVTSAIAVAAVMVAVTAVRGTGAGSSVPAPSTEEMGRDLRTLADLAGPENFTGTYSSATVVPRVDIVGTERTLANATVASLVHQLFVPRPEPVFAEWGVQANGSPPTSEKIAIIMADDRPLMSLDQVPTVNMQPEYHDLNMLSMTAVANMVYAARHGYDFKLMSLPAPRDRSPTWNKVRAIYAALAHYDLVAFIDTDSWFAQPSLSLAELMDRWRFGPAASLLLPLDPPGQPSANFNSTNTGFWLVRNTTVSRNALRALWRCPETIAECAPLKRGFPHEQGAFSRFIRPRLAEWDQLVIAPCEESNGFWRHWKCKGSVIVHPWDCKECVVPRVRDLLVREHWAVYRKMLHASHHVRCTGPDGLDACLEQEPV